MSKVTSNEQPGNADLRSHYDFSHGVQGEYRHFIGEPHTIEIHHADGSTTIEHIEPAAGIIFLEPDVREYFPNSDTVNKALRGLIDLLPQSGRDEVPDESSDKTNR